MKCSRCGHTEPNIECYVCWEDPDEGPDCFSRAKDAKAELDECERRHSTPTLFPKFYEWDGTE